MCVEGLVAILKAAGGFSVVGRSPDWTDGVSRAATIRPDVVVVDMAHCPECGTGSPMECVTALEGMNVVVLGTPAAGPTVVDILEAGALGYISLDAVDPANILGVLRSAAAGQATLDSKLSTAVLTRMRTLARSTAPAAQDASPTQRESAILELLVAGNSNRAIAQRLHISESTVKNHVHALYSKLGVQSRAEAVREAIGQGLVRDISREL